MLSRKLSFTYLVILIFSINYNIAYGEEIISNTIPAKQYFTGRESVLKELQQAFKRGDNIVCIVGISGIGKTELVRKFIELNRFNYQIIWVFDSNIDLRYQFQELARTINKNCDVSKQNCIDEELEQAAHNVMNYLFYKKDWLLVFDNLQIGQNYKINKLIKKEYKHGRIIIISQDKEGLTNDISLKEMSPLESKKLINKLSVKLPKETKELITQEFLGYPLPIVTTTKFLEQNTYISFEEYKNLKYANSSNEKLQKFMENIYHKLDSAEKKVLITCAILDNHHLSKNLLVKLKNNNILDSIYKLHEVSLISNIETRLHNPKNAIFEMHDLIKKTILNIADLKDIESSLTESIQIINSIFPQDVSNYSSIINEYPYLIDNAEKLLENATHYNTSILDTMELRKNLLTFYIHKLDYKKAKRMVDWLDEQDQTNALAIDNMDIRYKEAYAWFYTYKGVYLDFANGSAEAAILSFKKAVAVIEKFPMKISNLQFTTYAQLAQTLIYIGNIKEAQTTLAIAENYIKQLDHAGDWGLLWFLKAKILLEMGQYEESLIEIDKGIDFETKFQDEIFTAPARLLKAEILVRCNKAHKANSISSEVFSFSVNEFNNDHEFKARALMIHGLVKLHLREFEDAYKYIKQAKKIFINLPRNQNIELARIDDDLGQVIILEGELETFKGNYAKAIELYKQGKEILENRYGLNLSNDRYSLLLYKLIIAHTKSNQVDQAQLYLELHDDIFSAVHYRTKDIYAIVYGN